MCEQIVHIEWKGPYPTSGLDELCTSKDYGVYAIYGFHPVYGPSVLLYIGKAWKRTFAERIPEEGWDRGSAEDRAHVEIYVGRLKGATTPSTEQWHEEIDLAEKLLIHAHGPAYNATNIMAVSEDNPKVCNIRVLNWGCHRTLRPEVSGRRWTKAATEQARGYSAYEMEAPRPQD